MSGYSTTPLARKLGLKDGYHIAMPGIPAKVRRALQRAIAGCVVARDHRSALDFILLFCTSNADMRRGFPRWGKRLKPAGTLWVAWPKKTSALHSDLDETGVRRIGLSKGLVDVKICAIDDDWSGLKFVVRLKDRRSN